MVYKTSFGDREVVVDSVSHDMDPYERAAQICSLSSGVERGRYSAYLRVSALSDCCPREYVIGYKYRLTSMSNIGPSLYMTFEIGNAVHERMQNNLSYFGDRLVGNWRCPSCGFRKVGFRPTHPCEWCGGYPSAFRYEEVSLKVDDPYKITGHIDAPLAIDNTIRVLDIKTISGRGFSNLDDVPIAAHAAQVLAYMRLAKYSDPPIGFTIDRDVGYVLYVCKEHSGNKYPMKAYVVKYKDYVELWEVLKKRMELHARGIEAMDPYIIPPLTECTASGFTSYRARNCPALDYCKKNT